MSLRLHRVPRDLFDALAQAAAVLTPFGSWPAAQYSKHLLLLRGVLAAGLDCRPRRRRHCAPRL